MSFRVNRIDGVRLNLARAIISVECLAQSSSASEAISMTTATGVRREDADGKCNVFVLSTSGGSHCFACDTYEEMEAWLRVLGKAIVRSTTTEWDDTSDRLEEQQGQ